MTLFDQIKADREAGTPGPWSVSESPIGPRHWRIRSDVETYKFDHRTMSQEIAITMPIYGPYAYLKWPKKEAANARRVARVPELEAIALAAKRALEAARPYAQRTSVAEHGLHRALSDLDAALKGGDA